MEENRKMETWEFRHYINRFIGFEKGRVIYIQTNDKKRMITSYGIRGYRVYLYDKDNNLLAVLIFKNMRW